MKLITTLKTLLLEYKLVNRFKSVSGQIVDIESNTHSKIGQGFSSNLQRIGEDEIIESFEDVKEIAVDLSNKILNKCDRSKKECGLLIRDNMLGFDYHFWLRHKGDNKLVMIINTSIRHPKKLFNTEKHNIIVIDKDGGHTILESFNNLKINGKIIQFYLLN